MVKMPRQVKRYSPKAGRHTMHTVERVKKRRASELKWGQRRFRRVTAGYRGSHVQNQRVGKSQPNVSTFFIDALKPERHILLHANERRNSNSLTSNLR